MATSECNIGITEITVIKTTLNLNVCVWKPWLNEFCE